MSSGFYFKDTADTHLLGEAVPLIGQPDGDDYLPVSSVISRASYPDLSAKYPSLFGLVSETGVLPATLNWTNVAYGNGVYVAIASGVASCATSTDGINWTIQLGVMPSANSWSGLTFGNGVFVAVSGTASTQGAYSSDGITWYASSFLSQAYSHVAYGAGLFVAQPNGATSVYITSPDGINWTTRSGGLDRTSVIKFVNSLFFRFMHYTQSAVNFCYTSSDGISWANRTLPATQNWTDVTWDGTQYIVISTSTSYATSPNGQTWTLRTVASNIRPYTIATVGGYSYAIGNASSVYVTKDGIIWNLHSIVNSATRYASIVIGSKIFAPNYGSASSVIMQLGYSPTLTLAGPAGYYVRVK